MKQTVNELIQQLQSSSSKDKHHVLVKLKVDFLKTNEGVKLFIEQGLKPCIKLFEEALFDEKSMELVISIFGHCCLVADGAKVAVESENFIPLLSNLLIRSNNASTKARVLRLGGNIVQNAKSEPSEKFQELQHAVCVVLEKAVLQSDTIYMLAMLVRAMRMLWASFINEFLAVEAIKKIVLILKQCFRNDVKQDGESNDKKLFHGLIEGTLKLLLVVVLDPRKILMEQMWFDVKSAKLIIQLVNSKFRSSILKILVQIAFSSIVVEALTLFDGVSVLTSVLNHEKTSQIDFKNATLILSTLTGQSSNRLKVRQSDVFRKMVEVSLNSTDDEEVKMIIFTFYQFRFDPLSLECLFYYGIVKVLIKHLKIGTEKSEVKSDHHATENENIGKKRRKQFHYESVKTQNMFPELNKCGSPRSICSGYSSGPEDVSISYDYSPICSDADEEDEKLHENSTTEKQSTTIFDYTTLLPDEDSNCSVLENSQSSCKNSQQSITQFDDFKDNFVKCALELLVELSKLKGQHHYYQELSSVNTLTVLLEVFGANTNVQSYVTKVFRNTLSDVRHYTSVLSQSFIFDLFEIQFRNRCLAECSVCSQTASNVHSIIDSFSTNASSGYGKGELTKTSWHRSIMALYLLKCRDTLRSVLFDMGTLDTILDYIRDNPNEIFALHAVNGLTKMGINLNISLPEGESMGYNEIVFETDSWDSKTPQNEYITFVTSDDEEIYFEKEHLVKASDVFLTMFASSFKEAQDGKVELNYVKSSALKYFLSFLKLEILEPQKKLLQLTKDVECLLQAYHLSQIYLLSILEQKIFLAILKAFDFSNIHLVVKWAVENYNEKLFHSAVHYYLTSDIGSKEKLHMFTVVNSLSVRELWVEKLKEIILNNCITLTQ